MAKKRNDPQNKLILPKYLDDTRSLILSIVFISLWLVPMFYQGWTKKTITSLPPFMTNLQRASCLFTTRVPAWASWYLQAKVVGRDGFIILDVSDYSKLKPFGYHTRLDLMLAMTGYDEHAMKQRQAMADFISKKYQKLHPDSPPLESLSFVKAIYPVEVGGKLANPECAWTKESYEDAPDKKIISTHYFDGREGESIYLKRAARR